MSDFPRILTPVNHVEPVPRRIRATLSGQEVLNTTRALYVWEKPNYPHYYIPAADVGAHALVDEGRVEQTPRGPATMYGLRAGDTTRASAAGRLTESPIEGLNDMMRFEWTALDAWYEEDEKVFVHPRDPYTRVDAIRSTRNVRVEHHGVTLAQSDNPVLVFETGLPTRYYISHSDVAFDWLLESDTVTECPYKGTTSRYWSLEFDEDLPDIAWSYDFPTRQLLPIAGLVAFYSEKLDLFIDDLLVPRPTSA